MAAVFVLLVASSLWIAGLISSFDRSANKRVLEFWWALGAFFFGGIGTLASFGFVSLATSQGIALRSAPLILLGLAMAARTVLSRHVFVPPAGFALLLVFAILFAGDGFLMPLASFLAYLPALIVPAAGYNLSSLRAGATAGISLFLVLLVGLCLLQPENLIGACRSADKCSYWNVALGALTTGNALGVYLAAAGAITMLAAPTLLSFLLALAGSFFLTELTASRSGLAAWCISVGVCIAHALTQRLRSRVTVTVAALVVCIAGAALPFMTWSASQFTWRPVLWWQAISLFKHSPLFGYGSSYWVRVQDGFASGSGFAMISNYSTHNIVTELLVGAGALGTFAFVLALVLAVIKGRDLTSSPYTIAIIGVFVALSFTEVTSAPGRIYIFDGIGIYLFLVASAVVVDRLPTGDRSNRYRRSRGSTAALPLSTKSVSAGRYVYP